MEGPTARQQNEDGQLGTIARPSSLHTVVQVKMAGNQMCAHLPS